VATDPKLGPWWSMTDNLPDSHAGLEKVRQVLACEDSGKTPLFLPAIYEHKAWFIKNTPSNISRDPDLLMRAVFAEFEQIGPDALTIGVDVYNLEAEAAGCQVTFYEGDDTSIPGIRPGNHVITATDNLKDRRVPNPMTDGRMPVNIETARQVVRELGDDLWIRGAVSGPFSLTISLLGAEELFMATLDNPQFVHELLDYAARIIKTFGQAYIDVGADVVLFDSQASADLLPPDMYEIFTLPVMKDIIEYFKQQGINDVPLVIGGTTMPLIENLLATGANNLLCDFNCDWTQWAGACRQANRSVRRNLDPLMLQTAEPQTIYQATRKVVQEAQGYPGFIMGTAVTPFGTPTENLLAVKQACLDQSDPDK